MKLQENFEYTVYGPGAETRGMTGRWHIIPGTVERSIREVVLLSVSMILVLLNLLGGRRDPRT